MTSAAPGILVIEDDQTLNRMLCEHLETVGHRAVSASSCAEARDWLQDMRPDVILLDVRLPDCSGLDFLRELSGICPVILLTAYGSIGQAVSAVQAGASDYLVKPVNEDVLDLALNRALSNAAMQRDLQRWQHSAQRGTKTDLSGDSPAMAELRRLVDLVAPSHVPVLLRGEGGSGKGVVAAAIHLRSARANGRLIRINCGNDLSLTELFGQHAPGGPQVDGLLDTAENGTVFLNDIEKLAPPLQARMSEFIEAQDPAQGREDAASVRVIAATASDLDKCLGEGSLSGDLYYRLSTFVVQVPPLRDRPEDVAQLAQSILAGRSFQRHVDKQLSDEAMAVLVAQDWPGNIRQLANVIERGIILSGADQWITPQHLGLNGSASSPAAQFGGGGISLRFDHRPTLEEMRDAYVERLLLLNNGNRQKTAADLGISERNLYRLIRKEPGD